MENLDMNGSLCGCLPDDLIEKVLARLPAANLLRLRTVCKKWSDIECFQWACSQVASYEYYFVKFPKCEQSRSLLCFDPSIHKWYNVTISYLPSEVGYPVSSSGGLICFLNKLQPFNVDNGVLFVSNPLAKTWKELPRFFCAEQPTLVSVIIWKRPSHYKVIVGRVASTEIFDSMEGKWRNTGSLPPGEQVPRNREFYNASLYSLPRNVAFWNGSLYCLTRSPLNGALIAFNIQDEVWSEVKTGRMPGQYEFRKLVMCNGHLVIVGKSVRQEGLSVCVWLLEWKTMKWREAGRMPQDMSDQFLRFLSTRFSCCSHGDLIFLTSRTCDMGLLFDMAQKMWRWVVSYPHIDGFSFEPRLDSQV